MVVNKANKGQSFMCSAFSRRGTKSAESGSWYLRGVLAFKDSHLVKTLKIGDYECYLFKVKAMLGGD